MKRAVILNGPPGSGKDTIGRRINLPIHQFKEALYVCTSNYFEVDIDHLKRLSSDRRTKEVPCEDLLGHSPRQALIHVSEVVIKPSMGKDYFGKKSAELIPEDTTVLFTDGGFREEVDAFCALGIETLVIQLHGRGTFEGDSRDYINLLHPLIINYRIKLEENRVKKAVKQVAKIIKEEWDLDV